MAATEVIEELKSFIETNGWGKAKTIKTSTRVEADMGISGMDAVDFVNEFANEFNVNVSEFDCSKYFYAEGGIDFINPILNLIKKDESSINIRPKDITIEYLADAVEAGKLV
jgi:acyl carrier protein